MNREKTPRAHALLRYATAAALVIFCSSQPAFAAAGGFSPVESFFMDGWNYITSTAIVFPAMLLCAASLLWAAIKNMGGGRADWGKAAAFPIVVVVIYSLAGIANLLASYATSGAAI